MHHFLDGARILDVERQLEVGTALGVKVGERGHVLWQLGPVHLGDWPLEHTKDTVAELAVVVQHGVAVDGEPDVALQTRGAHLEGRLESLDGVLGRVCLGSAMCKPDGWRAKRGESGRHIGNSRAC